MERDCLWLQTGRIMSENLFRKVSRVSIQLQENRWMRCCVYLGSFFLPGGREGRRKERREGGRGGGKGGGREGKSVRWGEGKGVKRGEGKRGRRGD